jgi:putative membrane protein
MRRKLCLLLPLMGFSGCVVSCREETRDKLRFWDRDKDGAHAHAYTTAEPVTLARSEFSGSNLAADKQALDELHRVNFVEIEAGRLGSEKGTTEGVRRYGENLMNDHRANDNKVIRIARDNNIALAQPALNAEEQRMMDRLRAASGSEFDREFLRSMATAHSKAIAQFEGMQPGLADSEVRVLVRDSLPTLRHHEQMANNLMNVE